MTSARETICAILNAADGQIVGRIRMQKIVYLLEQLGLGGVFKFSYYHYGPYSESLSMTLDAAEVIDNSIREEIGYTRHGNSYSIYKVSEIANDDKPIGGIPKSRAKEYISAMKNRTSVAIEIAATIHWLQFKERTPDWHSELQNRKASKATPENIQQACELLTSLGIEIRA